MAEMGSESRWSGDICIWTQCHHFRGTENRHKVKIVMRHIWSQGQDGHERKINMARNRDGCRFNMAEKQSWIPYRGGRGATQVDAETKWL